MLQAVLEQATKHASTWVTVRRDAEAADRKLGELPLVYDNGPHVTPLEFRGYAYEKRPSDISGATWLVYDETKPQIWRVPLRDEVVPKVIVRVPKQGYVIDGGYAAQLAPVLDHHGIEYQAIAGTHDLEVYRATKTTFGPTYEGRARVAVEGAWARESRTLDRGAIFIPIAQANARLIVHLLDPDGPDSFVQWGFVNTAFERKEYMEPYVVEEAAREMLAKDPALRAKFETALSDPEFAKSPQKRLEFFYRLHPAWDERLNLVPIYRRD